MANAAPTIPERPCVPYRPADYTGNYPILDSSPAAMITYG
jgi:hypothetical protein